MPNVSFARTASQAVLATTLAFATSACGSPTATSETAPPHSAMLQGVHRLSIQVLTVTQPPGTTCSGAKINSGGSGAPWYANFNCSNGMSYLLRGSPAPVTLNLPGGGVSELAYDVDQNGFSVGTVVTASGGKIPMLWDPAGNPQPGALTGGNCPSAGLAAGLPEAGWPAGPVVGQAVIESGIACWWKPGAAFLIPPISATPSIANDVNVSNVYVGQVGKNAAEGTKPAALTPIGAMPPSSLLAINSGGLAVGYEALPASGPCKTSRGDAIEWNGSLTHVPFFPGDCRARLLDVNEKGAAVGFGFHPPGPAHATGFHLPPPYPNGVYNLTKVQPGLTVASGIDDNADIIATDTTAGQVYVLI